MPADRIGAVESDSSADAKVDAGVPVAPIETADADEGRQRLEADGTVTGVHDLPASIAPNSPSDLRPSRRKRAVAGVLLAAGLRAVVLVPLGVSVTE